VGETSSCLTAFCEFVYLGYNYTVSKLDKILEKVLRGTSDANINFEDMRQLLNGLGFDERTRGSHHIYTKSDVVEIINLQPKGSKAKPYQVKQVRNLILKYKLAGEDHD
jgi:predicted RNA binding protein YcfA (HicA-like mRNA interferase family)